MHVRRDQAQSDTDDHSRELTRETSQVWDIGLCTRETNSNVPTVRRQAWRWNLSFTKCGADCGLLAMRAQPNRGGCVPRGSDIGFPRDTKKGRRRMKQIRGTKVITKSLISLCVFCLRPWWLCFGKKQNDFLLCFEKRNDFLLWFEKKKKRFPSTILFHLPPRKPGNKSVSIAYLRHSQNKPKCRITSWR